MSKFFINGPVTTTHARIRTVCGCTTSEERSRWVLELTSALNSDATKALQSGMAPATHSMAPATHSMTPATHDKTVNLKKHSRNTG